MHFFQYHEMSHKVNSRSFACRKVTFSLIWIYFEVESVPWGIFFYFESNPERKDQSVSRFFPRKETINRGFAWLVVSRTILILTRASICKGCSYREKTDSWSINHDPARGPSMWCVPQNSPTNPMTFEGIFVGGELRHTQIRPGSYLIPTWKVVF